MEKVVLSNIELIYSAFVYIFRALLTVTVKIKFIELRSVSSMLTVDKAWAQGGRKVGVTIFVVLGVDVKVHIYTHLDMTTV